MKTGAIAQVSIPVPLRRVYDFRIPPQQDIPLRAGTRVQVPFGRRHQVTGIVCDIAARSEVPDHRLRTIEAVLDREPVFDNTLLRLLTWAADYYHHPIGEVMHTALPLNLRNGRQLVPPQPVLIRLTTQGQAAQPPARAPVQQQLLELLHAAPAGLPVEQLAAAGSSWRRSLALFKERAWIEEILAGPPQRPLTTSAAPELSPEQEHAHREISVKLGDYGAFCLFGITGSGKTEVYMRVVADVLARGEQALLLVPEIGLTPQLVERFQRRFSAPIAVLHSQLTDQARHQAWWQAAQGQAKIILGTRSAVFVPMAAPGLIVIDEEHDLSFKQQDGFRYHARDVAVYRARLSNIPIVLGSATPSLETLANVERGRYQVLSLPARAGGAALPKVELVDLNKVPVEQGLALPVVQGIKACVVRGEQALVFINRRGYAPVLHCVDCGWQAQCQRCDARLIYHQTTRELRCHHCGARSSVPDRCEQCDSQRLHPFGAGTQRVEAALTAHFPAARIVRIDRDTTRGKDALATRLRQINEGDADILIGTQLLAKGHHFPKVTLVVVLNADQSLYGIDFRSEEQLVQQMFQVAGRAGREQQPGRVLIQTRHPEHPLFRHLLHQDYEGFAREALAQRASAGFPPLTYFALLRAEAAGSGAALKFLHLAQDLLLRRQRNNAAPIGLTVGDPVPAPMEKRAGRYRAQLLLRANQRQFLHQHLQSWLQELESAPAARRVRWSLDIDPMEMW